MAEKAYGWDEIRRALEIISARSPNFLPNTVLVGGAACWYYRIALSRSEDPDFAVPQYSPSEESVWLSKDLDFMGESDAEVSDLIGQPCDQPLDLSSCAAGLGRRGPKDGAA